VHTVDGAIRSMGLSLVGLAILVPYCASGQEVSFSTLYSFNGSDGANPAAVLVFDNNGVMYGTTLNGGANQDGTVFDLAPTGAGAWQEAVLHSFDGSDGAYPAANVTIGQGALYGTAKYDGIGGGTVFQLIPPHTHDGAWAFSVLYEFQSGPGDELRNPNGGLAISADGVLYGTTEGLVDGGAAFSLTPPAVSGGTWVESTIFTFDDISGAYPWAGPILQGNTLYGTTLYEGSNSCGFDDGCGVVYALYPPDVSGSTWTESVIYAFGSTPDDGENPFAALTPAPDGTLYGTTFVGGAGPCDKYGWGFGCGTVFQLTPPATPGGSWAETVIYRFTGTDGDGAYPFGGVILASNGKLYGTTGFGGNATGCSYFGASGCGTIFELTPPAMPTGAWTERVLHSFHGGSGEGIVPRAGLTLGPDGRLYGTTYHGGAYGLGTVFVATP
jgi:uncharacterized repeat protein (TIGR03803 family)